MHQSVWACRDTSVQLRSGTAAAPAPAAHRPVEHLDRLLVLRRFYRNCIRAEVYHHSDAPLYTPFTDAELAEYVTEDDRAEAVADRKDEAMRALTEMQVIAEQIKVLTLLPQSRRYHCSKPLQPLSLPSTCTGSAPHVC